MGTTNDMDKRRTNFALKYPKGEDISEVGAGGPAPMVNRIVFSKPIEVKIGERLVIDWRTSSAHVEKEYE